MVQTNQRGLIQILTKPINDVGRIVEYGYGVLGDPA
jgi:hypothetical protein